MKRLAVLMLILALLSCAAASADLEDWDYYEGDHFTIRYPDYLRVYGVPEEETGWNMDVFEEPDGTDENGIPHILMVLIRADEADWTGWVETGCFPNTLGGTDQMRRVPADEPETELDISMDMFYALFRSDDWSRRQETIVFESPSGGEDYVFLIYFTAEDEGNYQNIFHWMLESLEIPGMKERSGSGSFILSSGFPGGEEPYPEVVLDEDAEPFWVVAGADVTDFTLERVDWDDAAFTVAGTRTLYTAGRMAAGGGVMICSFIPDMLPDLRIRAVNEAGEEEVWYISQSGMDGSLFFMSGADLLF